MPETWFNRERTMMDKKVTYKTFALEKQHDIAILKVRERRIYMNVSDQFRDEVRKFLDQNFKKVIVDLSQVSVMNSTGIGVLIALQSAIEKDNGRLKLVGLQPLMQDIFQRMRLEELFDIEEDMQKALQSLQK